MLDVRGVPALFCLESPESAGEPDARGWDRLPRWSGCLGRSPLGPRLRCESCGFFGLRGTQSTSFFRMSSFERGCPRPSALASAVGRVEGGVVSRHQRR